MKAVMLIRAINSTTDFPIFVSSSGQAIISTVAFDHQEDTQTISMLVYKRQTSIIWNKQLWTLNREILTKLWVTHQSYT